jgi:hypothetical protein
MIAKGRRLMRLPVANAIHALLMTLRQEETSPEIELVFIIPGELGKADFDGFEVDRARAGRTLIFIDVPRAVADAHLDEPVQVVIDLARQALAYGRAALTGQPDSPDFDAAERLLDGAASVMLGDSNARRYEPRESGIWGGGDPIDGAPIGPESGSLDSIQATGMTPSESNVTITLDTPDGGSLDDAFDFSAALEDRLERESAGYIDGNEVGQGQFTIYVYGPDVKSLRRCVNSVVDELSYRSRVTVRSTALTGEMLEP